MPLEQDKQVLRFSCVFNYAISSLYLSKLADISLLIFSDVGKDAKS